MRIELIPCNARGWRMGEGHHLSRHPDALVAEARAARAGGATYAAIGAALGVSASTICHWCLGARRKPAARLVAKRVAT